MPSSRLMAQLKERAKELSCLYEIEEIFGRQDQTIENAIQGVIQAIPPGWQYPDITTCQIRIQDKNVMTILLEYCAVTELGLIRLCSLVNRNIIKPLSRIAKSTYTVLL